ncbi:hypothetical protein KCU98_g1677, partial [Aureobasidium melanogenum]
MYRAVSSTFHDPELEDPIEDSEDAMSINGDADATAVFEEHQDSIMPSHDDVLATAKQWGMTTEELEMVLENTQRVSDIPLPAKDPKWKPPPKHVLQQPFQSEYLSPRADGLNEYIFALSDPSYRKVVGLLVKKYKDGTQQQVNTTSLSACFNTLLWLTHTTVLQAVAEGNIAQKYFNDKTTRLVLDFLSHESASLRVRPGVYCNAIGNRSNGEFLSADEVCQVLDIMSIYVQARDSALIRKLDNIINPKNSHHRLRYARTSRASGQISKFIKAARERRLRMGQGLRTGTPLPCSILEFGVGLDI